MKPFLRLIFLIVLLMFLILEHVSAGCIPFPPNVSAFCISGTREPNAPLSFSGSAFDPDRIVTGATPTWQWDFDYQGTFVCDYQSTTCGESNQESFCSASHVYAQPGVYVVAVKYFDDDGLPNIYTFSVQVGTTRLYYLKDHLGTIRMTVDQNAHLVSYDDYDPWGMQLPGRCANIGDGDPKYKFTGKERDVETGYDYFGARYYDAVGGRWLSVDPRETQYPGISPYCYAMDDPLRVFDPDGAGCWDAVKGFGFGFACAAVGTVVNVPNILSAQTYASQLALGMGMVQGVQKTWSDLHSSDDFTRSAAIGQLTFAVASAVATSGVGEASEPAEIMEDAPAVSRASVNEVTGEQAAAEPKGGTYLLKDKESGQVMRTGRSNNLARRSQELQRGDETSELKFEIDSKTDNYAQQRGREQIIHEKYRPLLNKINPISPRNPFREQYLDAAKELEKNE